MFDANVSVSETRCYIAVRIKVLCLKWQKSRGHLALWSAKTLHARIQQMSCSKLETLRWRCQILVMYIPFFLFLFLVDQPPSWTALFAMHCRSMYYLLFFKSFSIRTLCRGCEVQVCFFTLLSERVSVLRCSGVFSSYCPVSLTKLDAHLLAEKCSWH